VRAAAESAIPLISAVGHETDWTLIDYAADIRAPTPTGAAEMAVPVKADLEAQLANLGARLAGASNRQMDQRRQGLRALARALPSLDQLLALPRRRFDEAAGGLGRSLERNTLNKRRSFEQAASKLSPDMLAQRLAERRQRVSERAAMAERVVERMIERLKTRLGRADATLAAVPARLKGQTERGRDRLESLGRRADSAVVNDLRRSRSALLAHDRILQSLSYKNVLMRGYAVIRDAGDRPVSRAASLTHPQPVVLEFADGRVSAVTGEGDTPPAAVTAPKTVAKPARKAEPPAGQGSLF